MHKDALALPLDASQLRALIVGSAELGEMIMRAFILRRVGTPGGVASDRFCFGRAGSAGIQRLQAFLTRSGLPAPRSRVCARRTGGARQMLEFARSPA